MALFNNKPKQKPTPVVAIHTLLGKDTVFKGDVHSGSHALRIEGTVEGNIISTGEVTIAPTGLVTGTIRAKHLIVTGRAKGTLDIRECLEIHGTGLVEGDVEVGSLVVDEGGTLQGTCLRREQPAPEPKEGPKAAEPRLAPEGKKPPVAEAKPDTKDARDAMKSTGGAKALKVAKA